MTHRSSFRSFLSRLCTICALVLCGAPTVVSATTPSVTLERQVAALVAEVGRLKAHYNTRGSIPPLSSLELSQITESGVSWLLAAQEPNGHFRYEYVPYEDQYLDDDNMVRQAGALYGLGEALHHRVGDATTIEAAMERAIGYFTSLSQTGTYAQRKFRCIRSSEKSTECSLGTTALALIGVLRLAESDHTAARVYAPLIASYGAFVSAMQKDTGGFQSSYVPARERQSLVESSYSTGEALLALVRYDAFQPDSERKKAIEKTVSFIRGSVPFDSALYLWAMAALFDLSIQHPRADNAMYVQAYTDWRMAGFVSQRGTSHNVCPYTEGLVFAYGVLMTARPSVILQKYRDELLFWLQKGRSQQVGTADHTRVVFTKNIPTFVTIADPVHAYGGFLTGESELTERIDFTQHCLNTYMVWGALQK